MLARQDCRASRLAVRRSLRLKIRRENTCAYEWNWTCRPTRHSVLKDHLQGIDKQKEIELYYELLSSGHSVGEILNSLGHLQCKSEHGNVTTAEDPSSGLTGWLPT